MNGDGFLLHGKTLYVVQNQNNRIAVARLAPNLCSGSVTRTITSPSFDVPTTVASFWSRLYASDAASDSADAATTYSVVQVNSLDQRHAVIGRSPAALRRPASRDGTTVAHSREHSSGRDEYLRPSAATGDAARGPLPSTRG